jgi:protein-S-isoprenylcysteine O-methyltransferase Ste14
MYISVLTVLVGEALITRAPVLFLWAAIMATGFHVFVVAYEEPSLRRRFGAEYEAYCAAVGRWVPHRAVGLSDGAQ